MARLVEHGGFTGRAVYYEATLGEIVGIEHGDSKLVFCNVVAPRRAWREICRELSVDDLVELLVDDFGITGIDGTTVKASIVSLIRRYQSPST